MSNILVMGILVSLFLIYNLFVYSSQDRTTTVKLSSKALYGQKLWQDYNCWSCHQIYGLGGYLGPDLTNTYSNPAKGPLYIKAFLNSGIKSMPKFSFSEEEQEAIVTYLKFVDSTGYYPNYDANIKSNGWVEIKYKNEK